MKTKLLPTVCLLISVLCAPAFAAPISYAILTPTGELYQVVLNEDRADGKTHAQLKVTPVDATVPDGFRQDFSQGPKAARGWQLVNGTAKPILLAITAEELAAQAKAAADFTAATALRTTVVAELQAADKGDTEARLLRMEAALHLLLTGKPLPSK